MKDSHVHNFQLVDRKFDWDYREFFRFICDCGTLKYVDVKETIDLRRELTEEEIKNMNKRHSNIINVFSKYSTI